MQTVEIPLNHFLYRFRKLTYLEEFALDAGADLDFRRVVLAAAMVDVSGHPIASPDEAALILNALPRNVLGRIWSMYCTGLPESRFFTTRGLFRAPEPAEIVNKVYDETESQNEAGDRAMAEMERRFGKSEVAAAKQVSQRLVEDARRRGVLIPAQNREDD